MVVSQELVYGFREGIVILEVFTMDREDKNKLKILFAEMQ